MQRLFMLSVSAVAIIYGGDSIAETVHLKGTYGFTGTATCNSASAIAREGLSSWTPTPTELG